MERCARAIDKICDDDAAASSMPGRSSKATVIRKGVLCTGTEGDLIMRALQIQSNHVFTLSDFRDWLHSMRADKCKQIWLPEHSKFSSICTWISSNM